VDAEDLDLLHGFGQCLGLQKVLPAGPLHESPGVEDQRALLRSQRLDGPIELAGLLPGLGPGQRPHVVVGDDVVDEHILHMRKLLKTSLEDLDLSVRAYNCLKAAKINTLAEMVRFDTHELLKFRNFGKKSLVEIEELLQEKGLTFGMDLSKYKLEEE